MVGSATGVGSPQAAEPIAEAPCGSCGARVAPGEQFCTACGNLLIATRRRWGDRSVWWARRAREQSEPTEICRNDGRTGKSPFDLYCDGGQEHFMLFSGSRVLRHVILNAYRVSIGALVLAAANFKTTAPIYVVAWLAGLALLGLPLRAFRTSRLIAVLLWTAGIGLAAADYEDALSAEVIRAFVTGLVIVWILVATISVMQHPYEITDPTEDDARVPNAFAVRSVATGIVFGATLTVANLLDATTLGTQILHIPTSLRHVLLLFGVATLTGSVAVAASSGFLHGVRITDRWVAPLLVRDPTLPVMKVPRPDDLHRPVFRGRDLAARFAYATNVFVVATAQQVTDLINVVLGGVAEAVLVLKKTMMWLVNEFHRILVLTVRALAAALSSTTQVIRGAIVGVVLPLRRYHRSTIVTVAMIGSASALSVYAGHRFNVYLVSGGLGNAAVSVALALVVPAALVCSWWSLTGWPWPEVRSAAVRLLARAGPTAYLLVLALAWADGIAGWAGLGPIRPGWLTGAGTAALAVIYTAAQRPAWFGRSEH